MTKKIVFSFVIVLFLLVAAFAVAFSVGNTAYAEEEIAPAMPVGIDLKGADGKIEYRSCTLSGNGLRYTFIVTVDKELFRTSGTVENSVFAPSDILDEISSTLTSYGYRVYKNGKNDGQIAASIVYDETVDYYIANGITGYDKNVRTGDEQVGFLFTDYTREQATPLSSVNTEGSLVQKLFEKLVNMGAKEEKIALTYVYGTPYQQVKTDADRVEYVENERLYLHSFDMKKETSDRTITISQHAPNPTGWYVMAFLLAVPFVAIPLAVMLIRKKGGYYAR